jgi:hypothetical protein
MSTKAWSLRWDNNGYLMNVGPNPNSEPPHGYNWTGTTASAHRFATEAEAEAQRAAWPCWNVTARVVVIEVPEWKAGTR